MPLGQGPRLVEHDGVDLARAFEDVVPLDEDAELRASPGRDDQCGGCREAEGTGARDDQHRQCGAHRAIDRPHGDHPAGEGHDRQTDDGWDEDAGDTVGEALRPGSRILGTLDQVDHVRQLGVAPDGGRLDRQHPVTDARPPDDAIAGVHRHERRLPGDQAAVDRRGPGHHQPVGREHAAGSRDEPVADRELVDRDVVLPPVVAQQTGTLRALRGERTEHAPRAPPRERLVVAAGEDEGRHPGGDIEVERSGRGVGEPGDPERALASPLRSEHRDDRPDRRRHDPERDQRVHRECPVASRPDGAAQDGRGAPPDDRGRQGHHDQLPSSEAGNRNEREHDGYVAKRHEEEGGDEQPRTQCPGLVRPRPLLHRVPAGDHLAGLEPQALDLGDQCGRRQSGGNLRDRPTGDQVHASVDRAGGTQRPGDTRGARGARHPVDP